MNWHRIYHVLSRSLVVFAMAVCLFSVTLAPRPPQTYAAGPVGLPVYDLFNHIVNTITSVATGADKIKGYTLDPLAWALEKAVLQAVVNSTVKWINSGFNGSPAFVTNLGKTLQAVGDTQANSFIQQLQTNGSIKSPFQSQVASAVSANYFQSTGANGFFTQNPFTLSQSSANPTAFLAGGSSGFSQGGFNAFLSTAMNSSNNPYGATLLASQALGSQVAGAQSTQKTELQWGNGMLSYRGNCQTSTTGKSTASTASSTSTSLSTNSGCQSQNIITPGGAISSSLYKALGSGIDSLVSPAQFGEVLNALMSQLLNHVLGSGGLTGISQPSSATGGTAYFDQTTTATPTSTTLQASFTQTLSTQATQLQTFAAQWNSIGNAAQAAKNALLASSCSPNAQGTIASTVQPVIDQATTEEANANTSISTLTTIQKEVPAANSTTDATTQLAQASSDYSALLASPSLPSDSDIANASTQSIDTGTSTPSSLLSQMNEIAQAAQTCTTP